MAAVAVFMAAACGITGSRGNGVDNYFSAFETFPTQEWDYRAPAEFHVDTLRDSIARGGVLMLSLRHTAGYAYSNIWLELGYPDSDTTVRTDTFCVVLADKYGRWRGRGTGPSIQLTDTLLKDFTLRRGSTLTLRHIMRMDTLPGIEQAGIVYLPQ
ncbi:MAG: gliding motility lipoprotein GldH [Bacteroidales bacterium]|nr:gliding motility lipoprotein GldH [Bacteroidales bacterium]